MSGSYPSLRDFGGYKGNKPKGICEACARPATGYIRVAWDYMRGNDDSYPVCQKHMSMAQSNLDQCLAHIRTKDKFMARTK